MTSNILTSVRRQCSSRPARAAGGTRDHELSFDADPPVPYLRLCRSTQHYVSRPAKPGMSEQPPRGPGESPPQVKPSVWVRKPLFTALEGAVLTSPFCPGALSSHVHAPAWVRVCASRSLTRCLRMSPQMNDNQVDNWSDLDELKNAKSLETVYLERNPLQKDPQYRRKIMLALPSVRQIDATFIRF